MIAILVLGALMGALAEIAMRNPAANAGSSATNGSVSGLPPCAGDLNGDRVVNGADLSVLLANFGRDCNNDDNDKDGYSVNQGDCDDANPDINPGATEICDGFDNNCNGSIDEGNLCPGLPNAAGVCQNGLCTTFCNPGFGNCDSNIFNGCETSILTSVQHCGACGVACPQRPNTVITCINGVCHYTCAVGFADCNNNIAADGCEINIFTNRQNCGACGNNCVLTQNATATACFSGLCIITGCAAGFDDVNLIYEDGCETPSN